MIVDWNMRTGSRDSTLWKSQHNFGLSIQDIEQDTHPNYYHSGVTFCVTMTTQFGQFHDGNINPKDRVEEQLNDVILRSMQQK